MLSNKRRKVEANNGLLDVGALIQNVVKQTIETAYQENLNRGLHKTIYLLQCQLDASKQQIEFLQEKSTKVEKMFHELQSSIK